MQLHVHVCAIVFTCTCNQVYAFSLAIFFVKWRFSISFVGQIKTIRLCQSDFQLPSVALFPPRSSRRMLPIRPIWRASECCWRPPLRWMPLSSRAATPGCLPCCPSPNSSQKREGRSHVCAKGAKRTNDAPLGTADSWEPWPQPAGPCRSRWWVDTFAVNPWPRRSTDPPRRDPTPGTRGRTYRVRCWRSRTKPWWESRTDAADCWPSGPGPSRSGPWRAGGGSAPIYVNRGGCVDGGDAPGLFRRRDPGQESSGASGLPRARPVPQTPKVHRWAGRAVRGLWFVALPRSGWGQPRAQGPSAVPRELTAREFPWGPFDVAGHAPLPSLPCLPSRSGFSRLFTFHTSLDLNCPRRLLRGMAGHPMLSPMPPPRSLAFLASVPHAPPQLLRALLASFPCSSPRPPPPGL